MDTLNHSKDHLIELVHLKKNTAVCYGMLSTALFVLLSSQAITQDILITLFLWKQEIFTICLAWTSLSEV